MHIAHMLDQWLTFRKSLMCCMAIALCSAWSKLFMSPPFACFSLHGSFIKRCASYVFFFLKEHYTELFKNHSNNLSLGGALRTEQYMYSETIRPTIIPIPDINSCND